MAQHHLQLRALDDDGLAGRRRAAAVPPPSALPACPRALGQLRVDITRGVVEPIPSPSAPSPAPRRPTASRGRRSPRWWPPTSKAPACSRSSTGAPTSSRPRSCATPRFADWRQINAQALVAGGRSDPGGQLGVDFRLWDVFAGEQMRGLRFDAPAAARRRIAHKIADTVYERLTGEPGYFDTRIAYVAETGPPAGGPSASR